MPTKIFRISWDSSINLTNKNVWKALHQYFYDDFEVKELLKTPKIAMDLMKKIKQKKSRR